MRAAAAQIVGTNQSETAIRCLKSVRQSGSGCTGRAFTISNVESLSNGAAARLA